MRTRSPPPPLRKCRPPARDTRQRLMLSDNFTFIKKRDEESLSKGQGDGLREVLRWRQWREQRAGEREKTH